MGATYRAQAAILDEILHAAEEVEHHVHNYEDSFGLAAVPVGETHRADDMSGTPFQFTAGNNTWGNWLQILGSEDTPFRSSKTKFDLSFIHIVDANNANVYKIQIAFGASGAAGLAAGAYTEFYYKRAAASNRASQDNILNKRVNVGTKVWARIWCVGASGSTLDAFFGSHEYDE